MDFCYFVGKLHNFKENCAFANITSGIANFLDLAQLLHLGGTNLFRSFLCDLRISAVAFCYIMRWYMHRAEYFAKYQDEYDYPIFVVLFHITNSFQKYITHYSTNLCSFSAKCKIMEFFCKNNLLF